MARINIKHLLISLGRTTYEDDVIHKDVIIVSQCVCGLCFFCMSYLDVMSFTVSTVTVHMIILS